jgi:polar amino acid transport system permease protein
MPVSTRETAGAVAMPAAPQPATRRVVRHRTVGPWLAAGAAVLLLLALTRAVVGNDNIDLSQFRQFVFSETILRGVLVTIKLSVIAMVVAAAVAVAVAMCRLSTNRILSGLAGAYVAVLRAVPLILQLLLWGNIGLLFPTFTLGVPFTDISWYETGANELMAPFVAAVVGLAFHESAYLAEIIRAGIRSVDKGQSEAAAALGLTPARTMRRIVLPQAIRFIIPPTGNQFIMMIKGTSIVSVIAGGDLLTEAQNISADTYRTIEMLAVAAFWYLILVGVATFGQWLLERRFARGEHR